MKEYLILLTMLLNFVQHIHTKEHVIVEGHQKATDFFVLSWKKIPDAKYYKVYRLILCNQNTKTNNISKKDFHYLESTSKTKISISSKHIPIRRYIFFIEALDSKEQQITNFTTSIVFHYPKNIREFLRDVDFTIAHAQKQIPQFGMAGSKKTVKGLAHGSYEYFADLFASKSSWQNYSSFEITLNGDPKISIIPFPIGAEMTGVVHISGLYEGEIIYQKLFGVSGGLTHGGKILARYKHPDHSWIEDTFSYKEAGKFLKSVIISPSEINRPLSFIKGYY